MEHLRRWLTDEGLTQETGAARLGVSVRRFRAWIYEGRRPGTLEEMHRIAEVTGGQIKILDWLKPAPCKD